MITSPGIYQVSHADYHADCCPTPSLSSSVAKVLLRQSPAHAAMMHPKLNPSYVNGESSRFDLGTMAHALLLEDDSSRLVTIEADDWRTKAAKEARDAARAEGRIPILVKQAGELLRMVGAARDFLRNSEVGGIRFKAEQTIAWKEGQAWCRARPDWLSDDCDLILDYKTTDDASPDAAIRQIGRMGYDTQAAFYLRGLQTVRPLDNQPVFAFLFQEIEPPFACSLIALSNAYLEIAEAKVERAIKTWGYCLKTGDWHSYTNRIMYADPAAWAMAEYEATFVSESEVWHK
jgi:PDDEXK-like domain of unknown function (DUF3799)